jgi:hypothetical protein
MWVSGNHRGEGSNGKSQGAENIEPSFRMIQSKVECRLALAQWVFQLYNACIYSLQVSVLWKI